MLIYIIILVFVYFISAINSRKIDKLDIVFFVFLSVVSGFRYGVGTDFFGYVNYFNLIDSGYTLSVEPGFRFLSTMFSTMNFNSQALFLTLSILTMTFIYKGINYYTKGDYTYKPVLYIILLIFTFFPSLNGARQALAAAIIFYASRFIVEKNFFKFSIWVFFAALFHYSSIIFFGLYFIATKDFKRITLLIVLFFSFFLAKFGMINGFLEYILLNFSFLDIGGYIENYLYSSYNAREGQFGIVYYINVLILIVFIILKDRLIKNDRALLSFNFFYLFILSNVLAMDATMLARLTYFFSIYMAICIPRFGLLFDRKSRKIVEYTLIGLYSLLFLYIILNGYLNPGQTDFIPYDYNFNLFN